MTAMSIETHQDIKAMAMMPEFDYVMLLSALALMGFGLVIVMSASLHKEALDPFLYVRKHLYAMTIGLCCALVVMKTPIDVVEKFGIPFYFMGIFLLILAITPGLGKEVNGATRWIEIGHFRFQSSEFMKLFLVVYLANYLSRRQLDLIQSVKGFIRPLLLVAVVCGLLMIQPDFGTTFVLLMTTMGMLFLGGVPLWHFAVLLFFVGIVLAGLIAVAPYRLERLTSFSDPFAHAQDSGYQLTQALIAFGRGEWLGVGLGDGIQKQFYLPEAHTDFVMAVVGEELGFVGTLVIISLFGLLVWRAFKIGIEAEAQHRRFGAWLAQGCALWIGIQSMINIGVNVGLLPTKGLTLPFMSYGGNSLIVACVTIALLLRVDYENRYLKSVERAEVEV